MSRAQKVANASSAELNAYAQSLGFPSAAALQTIVKLGSHLRAGGKITQSWVDKVAQVYPNVPFNTIAEYGSKIRTVNDLASVVGVDATAARDYIETYDRTVLADHVSAKVDAHKDTFRAGGLPPASNPALRVTPKTTLRDTLNKLYANGEPDPSKLTADQRSELVERALTNIPKVQRQREALYEREKADPSTARWAVERSTRGDIELAYDASQVVDAAHEELSEAEFDISTQSAQPNVDK